MSHQRQRNMMSVKGMIGLCTKAKREEVRLAAIRELLDRGFGRPVAADSVVMTPAAERHEIANVVRVPYPCQSAEQWQQEADEWRRQKAKIDLLNAGTTSTGPLLDPSLDPRARPN